MLSTFKCGRAYSPLRNEAACFRPPVARLSHRSGSAPLNRTVRPIRPDRIAVKAASSYQVITLDPRFESDPAGPSWLTSTSPDSSAARDTTETTSPGCHGTAAPCRYPRRAWALRWRLLSVLLHAWGVFPWQALTLFTLNGWPAGSMFGAASTSPRRCSPTRVNDRARDPETRPAGGQGTGSCCPQRTRDHRVLPGGARRVGAPGEPLAMAASPQAARPGTRGNLTDPALTGSRTGRSR